MGWRSMCLTLLVLSVVSVFTVQTRVVRSHVNNICSTWGRGHFRTFDGDVYQFPGMCEYNLVSDCHKTKQEFSVHMKRRDGNSTVSYVLVTINDVSFNISKDVVTVNGITVIPPHYQAGVKVTKTSVFMWLQSKVGINVFWNIDDAVTVEVDRDYASRTCGLCGDFNGVKNELKLDGRRITPIEFGNRNKVHLPNDKCEDPKKRK